MQHALLLGLWDNVFEVGVVVGGGGGGIVAPDTSYIYAMYI